MMSLSPKFDENYISTVQLPCSHWTESNFWMKDYSKEITIFFVSLGHPHVQWTIAWTCRCWQLLHHQQQQFYPQYHKIWLLLSNFFKEPPNAHIRAMRGQILFTLHPFHLLVWNQVSSTMSPCMCPFHLQQTLLWGRKLKINGRKFLHPVYIL